jgi:hypothetical protein
MYPDFMMTVKKKLHCVCESLSSKKIDIVYWDQYVVVRIRKDFDKKPVVFERSLISWKCDLVQTFQ